MELGGIPGSQWDAISRTPGGILGSTRRKLGQAEVEASLEQIEAMRIGYCFIIGATTLPTTALPSRGRRGARG